MWLNTHSLISCCFAILFCMEELVASQNVFWLKDYSAGGDYSRKGKTKRALPRRSYCGLRGCCPGRDDGCTVPYYARNATCYCDSFCSSDPVGSIDCCPDFWTVCHQQFPQHPTPVDIRISPAPQVGCFTDEQHHGEGAIFKDNCNSCKCVNSHWKCSSETCLVRPSLIKQINEGNYGWKAHNYSQFWGMSLKEGYNSRLGTLPPPAALLDMKPVTETQTAEDDFPEFFVAWHEWPGWIHDPLDQRNCAASWAFSTASVAADRIAIHSKGRFTDNLSPQHLISCDTRNQYGCKGGSIMGAWSYLKKYGLVSHACYPLFWNHIHQTSCEMSSVFDVEGKRQAIQSCPNCWEPSNRIYQCGLPYRISSQEADIMKEIKENGPVQGKETEQLLDLVTKSVMQVYDDFFLYKSGIYKHIWSLEGKTQNNHQKKPHSVKIVGWGTLRDAEGQRQKFWIAANSWGNSWGENGYFMILRGQNECDIEKMVIASKCYL